MGSSTLNSVKKNIQFPESDRLTLPFFAPAAAVEFTAAESTAAAVAFAAPAFLPAFFAPVALVTAPAAEAVPFAAALPFFGSREKITFGTEGALTAMLSPDDGRARPETTPAEMAMNVRMDPKFFMMKGVIGDKRQARKSIWM